jgi:uncharacterized SAM-binding protein YcdF (DUF218 family)
VKPDRSSSLKRKSRLRRWARVSFVLLVAWPLLAWLAARALVVRAELQQADAIIVLSGSANYVERARWAARLYKEGRAPKIILTNDNQQGGWSSAQERNPFFVELAADELKRAGVPADRIEVLPQTVSSTYDECAQLHEYALRRGLRSLLFVTSAYHTRRTLWTLQRLFRENEIKIGLDAPPPGEQSPPPAAWWLQALGWRMVAGEYLKILYYHLHYR